MPDVLASVDRALALQVEPSRRRGENLAHPVRRQGDVGRVGILGHPLPAPPRQVGNQDVLSEMQLGLVDDPPSAGAAATPVEGSREFAAQSRTRQRVRHCRPRLRVEDSVDDLGHPIGRGVEHVLVGSPHGRVGLAAPDCSAAGRTHQLAPFAAHGCPWRIPETRSATILRTRFRGEGSPRRHLVLVCLPAPRRGSTRPSTCTASTRKINETCNRLDAGLDGVIDCWRTRRPPPESQVQTSRPPAPRGSRRGRRRRSVPPAGVIA